MSAKYLRSPKINNLVDVCREFILLFTYLDFWTCFLLFYLVTYRYAIYKICFFFNSNYLLRYLDTTLPKDFWKQYSRNKRWNEACEVKLRRPRPEDFFQYSECREKMQNVLALTTLRARQLQPLIKALSSLTLITGAAAAYPLNSLFDLSCDRKFLSPRIKKR